MSSLEELLKTYTFNTDNFMIDITKITNMTRGFFDFSLLFFGFVFDFVPTERIQPKHSPNLTVVGAMNKPSTLTSPPENRNVGTLGCMTLFESRFESQ